MKNKGKFITAGISFALFALLILLVRLVDVAAIGPEGTVIGLSHLNRAVSEFFGVNMVLYDVTDWLGIAAILTVAIFAVTGLVQLISRRSLFKVDKVILALGVLYAAIAALYVLFEVVIVNYRPVIMPGCTAPEASFPSSHTMLVCVVMVSTMMVLKKYVKPAGFCTALKVVCAAVAVFTVCGRLISGVHWFTDIIGGVLISTALLALFSGVGDSFGSGEKQGG